MGGVLSRALLLETLRSFVTAFVACAVVFLIAALYEMIYKGVSGRQIGIVVPYVIIYTLPFLLPVSLLIGVALATGRLAADNEVVAVSGAGLPTTVLARPALFLGLVASCLLFGLEGSVIPYGWLKKKDLVRAYIEELTDLGEGENKPISSGSGFHFFCRRHAGSSVEGVEIVYSREPGDRALVVLGDGPASDDDRPVEISAARGEIRRDEARDAVVIELWDVALTRYESPPGVSETAVAYARRAIVEPPPRGAPSHATLSYARIELPSERRVRDRTEYRSSAYLAGLIERLGATEARALAPALTSAEAERAALALAAGVAAPGAVPGASALAAAGLAAASPGAAALGDARERRREARGYLEQRRALSTGPLLFALLGALVPLRVQHPNRLVPFVIALAAASALFFLPFVSARNAVEPWDGASPSLYWVGPALTAAVAAALFLDVRRR
jgi:hypothetical protein